MENDDFDLLLPYIFDLLLPSCLYFLFFQFSKWIKKEKIQVVDMIKQGANEDEKMFEHAPESGTD